MAMKNERGVMLLRASLGSVFLWFGIDKLINSGYWFMWTPQYLQGIMEALLGQQGMMVFIKSLGVLEMLIGAALVFGAYVKLASLLASAFLLLTIVSLGVFPVIRDVGLLGVSLYLYLLPGKDTGPRISVGDPKALVMIAGLAIAALTASFVFGSTGTEQKEGQDMLSILNPSDGSSLGPGKLDAEVRLLVEPDKIGANHVHIKLDDVVMDAIYVENSQTLKTTLNILPGNHKLSAYLAMSDHREIEGSSDSVRFSAG